MLVVGKRKGSFTDKKTGEVVNYARVYVTYPLPQDATGKLLEGCYGIRCEELHIPVDIFESVKLNTEVNAIYNRWGHIDDLQPVGK